MGELARVVDKVRDWVRSHSDPIGLANAVGSSSTRLLDWSRGYGRVSGMTYIGLLVEYKKAHGLPYTPVSREQLDKIRAREAAARERYGR